VARKTTTPKSGHQPEIAGRLQELVDSGDMLQLARRSMTLQSVMLDLHGQLAVAQSQAELGRTMGLALTGSFGCERLVVLRRDRTTRTFEMAAEIGDVPAALHEEAPLLAARLSPFLPHVAPLAPLLPAFADAVSDAAERLAALGFVRAAWLNVAKQVDWLVFVGPKLSGAEYDTFDTSLLQATLQATSLACNKLLLVDALEERNRELVQANRRLQQIDDLKSAILSGVSHELRTPLHRIHMYAETLRDEPPGDGETRDYLNRILANTRMLDERVDAALRFAELIGGRSVPQLQPMSLAEAVDAAVRERSAAAAAHSVRIEVGCEPLAVLSDASYVGMILGCLLDNAVKFTPPGGTVRVEVEGQDGGAVVRVADMGPGIPEAARERIWRLFETGEVETPGLGVGLALAQRLATELDVHLELLASNIVGSVFAIRFADAAPIVRVERAARATVGSAVE
jgi:signal transduction histidine kinase